MAILGLFFIYFLSFSNKQYKFYNKLMSTNVHPVSGARIQTHNLLIMNYYHIALDMPNLPIDLSHY